jgi:hypothetical protein
MHQSKHVGSRGAMKARRLSAGLAAGLRWAPAGRPRAEAHCPRGGGGHARRCIAALLSKSLLDMSSPPTLQQLNACVEGETCKNVSSLENCACCSGGVPAGRGLRPLLARAAHRARQGARLGCCLYTKACVAPPSALCTSCQLKRRVSSSPLHLATLLFPGDGMTMHGP